MPNFVLRNCMNCRLMSALVVPRGCGRSETRFGGTKALEALLTSSPKFVMPMTLRKPPGQRPIFCVSTFSVYSGLAEYTLNVDTQKMGLWPGGFLNVMGMTNFGDDVNNASRAFVPPNLVSLLPQPRGTTSALMR